MSTVDGVPSESNVHRDLEDNYGVEDGGPVCRGGDVRRLAQQRCCWVTLPSKVGNVHADRDDRLPWHL